VNSMEEIAMEENISNIELASVNFDQWVLTVGLRAYASNNSVLGMVHVIFKDVRGFRYLDEGDMLRYPFPDIKIRNYFHHIASNGWSDQESDFGNVVTSGHQEYLVATSNECLSVLSYSQPIIVKSL